jgi:SAM-dependent methyltransferase
MRQRARYGVPDFLVPRAGNDACCLEIGPGRGNELRRLRRIGWNAQGLDVDPSAAAVAEGVSGCKVHVGSIVDASFTPCTFDLIYMSHVLEHLPDLLPSLTRLFQLLTSRGRAVMIYPNPSSLMSRLCSEFSPVWDAPRHLVLPTPDAIRQALRFIGFENVWMRTLSRSSGDSHARVRHYKAQH